MLFTTLEGVRKRAMTPIPENIAARHITKEEKRTADENASTAV